MKRDVAPVSRAEVELALKSASGSYPRDCECEHCRTGSRRRVVRLSLRDPETLVTSRHDPKRRA